MPDADLLDPKLDVIFKLQFGQQPDLLRDLINAIRSDEPPVVSLVVKNPNILAEELEGKHIVLDIWAQDANGQQFDIEMQTNKHAGWSARSVYYLARALGEQLHAGQGYDQIQPVIGIHLLAFDLFKEPDQSVWTFELRDRLRPDVVLDRSLQLNVVELRKADRLHAALNPVLAQWITYFQHWREDAVMQQIQHPSIQKAYRHLNALSGDEHARAQAYVRERAMRDAITEKSVAKAEGLAKGMAEGLAKGLAKGESRFLRHLLQAKFGALPFNVEDTLQRADSSQLETWGERVLTANTLDQVFNQH